METLLRAVALLRAGRIPEHSGARDFFELFCSVDGVGVKKALRAMTQPVQDTAIMIEQQDAKAISGLPGVGPATAERIIAKLRRKMPKFALLVRRETPAGKELAEGVVEDTYRALIASWARRVDARRLIEQALQLAVNSKTLKVSSKLSTKSSSVSQLHSVTLAV